MALQATLDTLDGVDKSIADHYTAKDGKFHLAIEGLKPQAPGDDYIPKTQFDQVNEKAKTAEDALKSIADGLLEDVPDEFKDIIPDLPAAHKINWIRNAKKKGLFAPKAEPNSPDSKRPGGTAPTDFKNMSPQAIMATGYKK